jgi:methane monooxygenase component A beta chain/propane monooxygenase small subunit
MEPIAMLPEGIAGKRDLAYITPKRRRLTEYEAVTCYTQPQPDAGGIQTAGDFMLRNDGRPIFDVAGTELSAPDWFAFRDPSQMWQRPYYDMQAEAERAIERATNLAISTGMTATTDTAWIEHGVSRAYLPFAHVEYGLFRSLNCAAREALSDTVTSVLVFNASDKLRHAQAISILGLDLESAVPGFDGTQGREIWLEDPGWQDLRRLVEEVMCITDWGECLAAANLAIEPLLGDPLRRFVFGLVAARQGDSIVPVIAGTATADWQRNALWTEEFCRFATGASDGNHNVLEKWRTKWLDRTRPVAAGLFALLEETLGRTGLAEQANTAGAEQCERMGRGLTDGQG